jgi:hypothetical protein
MVERPLTPPAACGSAAKPAWYGLASDIARDFSLRCGMVAARAVMRARTVLLRPLAAARSSHEMSRMFQLLVRKIEDATSWGAEGCAETPQAEGMSRILHTKSARSRRKARRCHFSEK